MTASRSWPRSVIGTLLGVFGRPALWPTALRWLGLGVRASLRRGVSLRPYLRMRAETAYGDAGAAPEPRDVLEWLDWCRHHGRGAR